MPERDWADELRQALTAVGRLQEMIQSVEGWLRERIVARDVWPREMPEPLRTYWGSVHLELNEIRGSVEDAFDRYSANPGKMLLSGRLVSREEYYVLRAMGADFGARELGLGELDDYEICTMLWVETDRSMFYINVASESSGGPSNLTMRFGRAPEDIMEANLRPEQREIFARHLPEVYARFRREPDRPAGVAHLAETIRKIDSIGEAAGSSGGSNYVSSAGGARHVIAREAARDIASWHLRSVSYWAGARVREVLAWNEIRSRKPAIYNAPPNLEDSWICYLEFPDEALAIRSSSIIAASGQTGAVLYAGDAGDEG